MVFPFPFHAISLHCRCQWVLVLHFGQHGVTGVLYPSGAAENTALHCAHPLLPSSSSLHIWVCLAPLQPQRPPGTQRGPRLASTLTAGSKHRPAAWVRSPWWLFSLRASSGRGGGRCPGSRAQASEELRGGTMPRGKSLPACTFSPGGAEREVGTPRGGGSGGVGVLGSACVWQGHPKGLRARVGHSTGCSASPPRG